MNDWIRNVIHNGERVWYTFKTARAFKKRGIPRYKCDICGRGVVEWTGCYKYSPKVFYNTCNFCAGEMGANYNKVRYEVQFMVDIEKKVFER